MIPAVDAPSDAVREWARVATAAVATIAGPRHVVWHAVYGLAAGWYAATPTTHPGLPTLVDEDGDACSLAEVATTWIAAGCGCSLALAHRVRADLCAAVGVGLVRAAGAALLVDPRSVLCRLTADQRAGFRLAARAAAARGDLRRPLLDQVPLGPPIRLRTRTSRGKQDCPWCGSRALAVRRAESGHRTGWCHSCQCGGTVTGRTIRGWEGRARPPSENGRPDPGLHKRPGQRRGRHTRYRWDPDRPRNNDPRGPGGPPAAAGWRAAATAGGLPDGWSAWAPWRAGPPGLAGWALGRGGRSVRGLARLRLVGPDGVLNLLVRRFDGRWLALGPGATDRGEAWVADLISETTPNRPEPGPIVAVSAPRHTPEQLRAYVALACADGPRYAPETVGWPGFRPVMLDVVDLHPYPDGWAGDRMPPRGPGDPAPGWGLGAIRVLRGG